MPVHRFAVSASSHSRGALTSALPLVHFLKDVPRPALRLRIGHHVSYDDGARRSDCIHGGIILQVRRKRVKRDLWDPVLPSARASDLRRATHAGRLGVLERNDAFDPSAPDELSSLLSREQVARPGVERLRAGLVVRRGAGDEGEAQGRLERLAGRRGDGVGVRVGRSEGRRGRGGGGQRVRIGRCERRGSE